MPYNKDEIANAKLALRETKRTMKERGIRRTSCFNGGLSADEYRFNAHLFELKTRLERLLLEQTS